MSLLFHPIARYTRFVGVGKHALWLLAVLLTALLIVLAWINAEDTQGRIVFSGETPKSIPAAGEPAAMLRPHYTGLDDKDQPFSITADRAVQQDKNTITLETLSADMTLNDAKWLALTASQGVYLAQEKRLQLQGDIHLYYDGGYEFRTERATVEIKSGAAHGDAPVSGQGPSGTLLADRFTIEDRGAILHFDGHVKVVLYR